MSATSTSFRISLGLVNPEHDVKIFELNNNLEATWDILEVMGFSFLDSLLGTRWDIKKSEDSGTYFHFITNCSITVDNSSDALVFKGYYTKSTFTFEMEYRVLCADQITARRASQ